MKLCVISAKESWQDEEGKWVSNGGFPLQMAAIGSLFDEMKLLVVQSEPKDGWLRLPEQARIVAVRKPDGMDLRRKIAVVRDFKYYWKQIYGMCREADVVHVPPPGDMMLLGMVAALLLRKRLIVRYCGSWHATAQTTFMNRVTRGMMRMFAGGKNLMLATGGGVAPPAKNVSWIFASALSQEELNTIRPKYERTISDPPRLIYAGRLSPEKGVARLVRVVGEMRREGFARVPLVTLAGNGPERQALERLAKQMDCAEHIRFVGQLNRGDLSREFSEADFCVQPSLTEGYSKAWLDAMAHGLPVVTSDVGAARAVLGKDGERGWIVPPGDNGALKTVLQQVIQCPMDWESLRRRCREFAEAQTLEGWARTIGERCAAQWGVRYEGGKLR